MIMNLDEFEKFYLEQKSVDTQDFSQEYFKGEWRAQTMAYDISTRREIEGKNPENIINFLKPKRAVDIGCGPGALISLLKENGFDNCYGVDISPEAKEMAESSIRDRIQIASAWTTGFDDNHFDTVICREVLEHLTVQQIFLTVKEMCRISSDIVYVTTRFHPEPESLYDVTTEFEVDPTHISCMNIDFLRLFFVLNNFKRDRELEAQIDWMKKGRALIYRKQN